MNEFPSGGRATLSSVAERAGVSKQTVSNVLNSPHLVRQDTARKVAAAIEEMGYRPHRAAQQLRTRRSNLLGLRVARTSTGDQVFDRLLHALTVAADDQGYRLMLYTAADDTAEIDAYAELHDRWDIDGVVLTSTHPGDRRTAYLSDIGLPFVSFGRPWDAVDNHAWVDVDGRAGTRDATAHLIAAGHRRIGFLGWSESAGVGADRMSGWSDALAGAHLDSGARRFCVNGIEAGRIAAAQLFDDADLTAIVCVSDLIGIGALAELASRGRVAGTDVAVVGFDDTDLAAVAGLASVAQPLADVARECIRLVLAGMNGRTVEQVLLAPSLTLRPSAGRSRPPPGIAARTSLSELSSI